MWGLRASPQETRSVIGPGWESRQAWAPWISTHTLSAKTPLAIQSGARNQAVVVPRVIFGFSLSVMWLSQTIPEACPLTSMQCSESASPFSCSSRDLATLSAHCMPITAFLWAAPIISKAWGQHRGEPHPVVSQESSSLPCMLAKWPYARSPFYKINFDFRIV